MNDLAELLDQVRQGDEEAAREVIRRYESAIRVAVRTRLSDPRLRRQFDTMDVCQSVLASFFVHVSVGTYDLRTPAQLLALLIKMVQNKLGTRARDQFRQCRDIRRLAPDGVEEFAVPSTHPEPSRTVASSELLDRALTMMSPEIRAIAVRRMQGELWPTIAGALGGTPDGRRKQFERAVGPIAVSLELHVREG